WSEIHQKRSLQVLWNHCILPSSLKSLHFCFSIPPSVNNESSKSAIRRSQPQTLTQTQGNQPTQQPAGENNTGQRRNAGRQPGSQGYSHEDSTALVEIVKGILPLGSNEWQKVHELYSDYAARNGRTPRDCEPLKMKFKALAT
ncbi:hypothetical protein PTTG_27759, partial [Puccinia triticina 1-1 BBBD Race 1]